MYSKPGRLSHVLKMNFKLCTTNNFLQSNLLQRLSLVATLVATLATTNSTYHANNFGKLVYVSIDWQTTIQLSDHSIITLYALTIN